jgi:hypothetical protein
MHIVNMTPDLPPELIQERLFGQFLGWTWSQRSRDTITVPGCSTGSGMIFVELRGTRILTEGDSRFYTQPEVGRWVAPSKCASGSFRVCQYGSFQCTSIAPSECTSIAPSECMLTVT